MQHNPLRSRVEQLVAKEATRGVLRDIKLDQFNNKRAAISVLKQLGFEPDDPYEVRVWIRRDYPNSLKRKTKVAAISEKLLETGVYYLGDFGIGIPDARHVLSVLKKRGWVIRPVKYDKKVIGYELINRSEIKKAQVSSN